MLRCVQVSRPVTTEEKPVDPSPAVSEPQEKSVPDEDSAAKETPTVEKVDEASAAESVPDQPIEEKGNGVEETSTKEAGETATERKV